MKQTPKTKRQIADLLVYAWAKPPLSLSLSYDMAGIKIIDEMIQSSHESDATMPASPEVRNTSIFGYGTFVGECLIAIYGGEWIKEESGDCVRLQSSRGEPIANPYVRVSKQFRNGAEDGVYGWAMAIGAVLKHPGQFDDLSSDELQDHMKTLAERSRYAAKLRALIKAGDLPAFAPTQTARLGSDELDWCTNEMMTAIETLDPANVTFPVVLAYKDGVATSVGVILDGADESNVVTMSGHAIRETVKKLKPSSLIVTMPISVEGKTGAMVHAEAFHGEGTMTLMRLTNGEENVCCGMRSMMGRLLWPPDALSQLN